MPRVISDELYQDLISNIHQQRLLGIMGKLERLRDEARLCGEYQLEILGDLEYVLLYEDSEDETKTNNN